MADAVIVVDMQKGFMAPGGTLYCGDAARKIVPRVRDRLEREKEAGAALFFTRDSHLPDDREFEIFPPHCVEGTSDEEIIDELADLEHDARVIKKRRYSAFFETDLADQLARLEPEPGLSAPAGTHARGRGKLAQHRRRVGRVHTRSVADRYRGTGGVPSEIEADLGRYRNIVGELERVGH